MAREIVSNTHQIVFLLCLAPPAAPHYAQNEARVLRPAGPHSLAFCLCPGASPSPSPCWSTPASLDTSLFKEPPPNHSWLKTFAFADCGMAASLP